MKQLGFTLVELIVTMGILAMITVGVIIQVRSLSPTQTLENGADLVRAAFLDMRTSTMTSQTCCGGVLPTGYGLAMNINPTNAGSVTVFADLNSNYNYDVTDTIIQVFTLNEVAITACGTSTTTITSGACNIATPIGGFNGTYWNGTVEVSNITLTLTHLTAGTVHTLTIYPNVYVID